MNVSRDFSKKLSQSMNEWNHPADPPGILLWLPSRFKSEILLRIPFGVWIHWEIILGISPGFYFQRFNPSSIVRGILFKLFWWLFQYLLRPFHQQNVPPRILLCLYSGFFYKKIFSKMSPISYFIDSIIHVKIKSYTLVTQDSIVTPRIPPVILHENLQKIFSRIPQSVFLLRI